jgi:rhamnulokinase
MPQYIAIDLGAESGRIMVATLDRGRLALEEAFRFPNGAVQLGDSLFWDVLYLWRQINDGLRKVRAENGHSLRSLAVDSWGIDYALLNRAGELSGNPRCYRDPRTTGMMERALALVPRWEIYQQSGGIQFMSINTLYQLLAMVERQDPALETAETYLMIPDLFHAWLTGRRVCEFTDATTTQFYRAGTGGWSVDLLRRLGIPTHIFPEVVQPGTILGPLLPGVAGETGLGDLPVVAPAAHDTASAIVAVPAVAEQFAWLSSGTWSLLGGISVDPIVTPEALDYNFSSYGGPGGMYLPWKNIMGLWLVQECRRAWAREGAELSYDTLAGMAASARPFVAVLDPDAPEFLAPPDMPEAIAAFCREHGEPEPADRGEMVRSVLESLALRYRWTLERLARLQGRTFDELYVVGGGSRNRLLCQFTADALGLPVVAGPVEATAIGNAALQAVALGDLGSLQEAREVVRQSFDVEVYEPGDQGPWDQAYQRFERRLQS